MKKIKSIISVLLCVCFSLGCCVTAFAAQTMLNVGDYVVPDTGKDISAQLQNLIDENPNRTLYFPDGEYLVSKPIYTPANPKKSVDLQLSNYTVIKASSDFSGEAVIALGGKDPYNDIKTPGSNYSLTGGIIDCAGIANGVAILSGRETKIQNTSIKNAVTGIYIGVGANNVLNYCYSDQFCTAYRIKGGDKNIFDNCFCMWWTDQGKKCTVIQSDGAFNSTFTNLTASLRGDTDNTMFKGTVIGNGKIVNLVADESKLNLNHSYKIFMSDSPILFIKNIFTKFINFFKNIAYLIGLL